MNVRNLAFPKSFATLLFLGAVCWLPENHAQTAGNLPPTVRITAPTDGAVFTAPADIVVEAEASDPDGWVSGMEVVIGPVRLVPVPGDPGTKDGSSRYRFTWPSVPVGEYLLVARAVDNQGAAANSPAVRVSVIQHSTEPILVLGYLRRQVYLDIPGITLADLTSSPKFPDQPDWVDLNTPFETPSNVHDNYGVRLTGFVLPPVTGEYVFYIASDDQGALFLSPDENPANKVQIAFEPTWSGPRTWIESPSRPEPSNISTPIPLEAGRKYYVEALMKEGGGGDNLAVTWQKPGDPRPVNGGPPIPGEYLATYWPHPITNRPPVVTITAPDPVATEQSPFIDSIPDTGRFVVARTGNLQAALTVHLEVGGTALNGTDYQRINSEVLIPSGSATADILLDPIDDNLVEGEESVVIRIGSPYITSDEPASGIQYIIGTPGGARAVIRDDEPQPNQPPQTAIVSPPDGAVLVAPETLRIIAGAADADGWVTSVEFFADGVSLGVVPQPPIPVLVPHSPDYHPEIDPIRPAFQIVWTNPPAGPHVLKAVATDNAGATGESAPVTLTILEPTSQTVVTVIATDPMAAEPSPDASADVLPDTAAFTIHRTGDLSIPLPVYYTLSGSASNGVDYAELPLTVTIPVNERSVNVVVLPFDDALIEAPERIMLTLEAPLCPAIWPPPPGCYLVGVPGHAGAVIVDNDPPTNLPPVVSLIHPSPGEVFRAGSDIRLRARAYDRGGSVKSVEFFEGERSLGVVTMPDPVPLPADPPMWPIPPGPIMEPLPVFSLTWSSVPAGQYVLKAVATDNLGAPGESQPVRIFVVAHEPPPIVTVEATVPETFEPGTFRNCGDAKCLPRPAIFTVSRTGPTNAALEVHYDLQGTAGNGVDYRELPFQVTIPAGQSSATVAVEALDDALVEGTETVILRLVPRPWPTVDPSPVFPSYLVGSPHTAQVVILEGDVYPAPHVEVVQPHSGQVFALGAPIEVIAATPVVPPLAITVEFYANGVKIGDGVEQPVTLIGARHFAFTWMGAPVGQHALVAKAFSADGQMGVSAPVWIALMDPQPPQVVTIEATDAVASEPGVLTVIDTAEFTVRRTGSADRPLTVIYRTHGTALNGTDYDQLTGTVTFGAGSSSATILVNALRDELVEGDESAVLTLTPPIMPPVWTGDPTLGSVWPPYVIGMPNTAAAVIRDANPPVNLPPTVRIAEPRDGWVFQNPPVIRLIASSRDSDGRVTGVEFFADGLRLGAGMELIEISADIQGFGLTWTNPPLGGHVLTARATDDDGAVMVSAPVHITVQPPVGDRELHVVGVYSGMSNGSSSRDHERGDAAVVVDRPGKYVTLVLSAYEPVLWHLTITEGTIIERLILGGYYEQTVEGLPAGVPVVTAYPVAGTTPWLWVGYAVESGDFYRALCRLQAMTSLEVASFHGGYTAPYPTPFVIDAVQNDPRLRSDYPQPAPLDQLPHLHFALDYFEGLRVGAQAYTLAGPVGGDELLPGYPRVTANADRTRFYGLADDGILEVDAGGRAEVIRAPGEVIREGWLMGATFDTRRERALLVTLSGEGGLYGYSPASGLWSTIASMNNVDLCTLAYHPGLDALFGLEVTRSDYGRPVLRRFTPEGGQVGQITLPFMPFDIGVIGHRAELVPVANYLVLLVAPMGRSWDYSIPDERMYLIDPATGQAWLTYRAACLCQGDVTLQATDPVASEPGDATVVDTATFTVSRTGNLTQPLTVRYSVHGSAQNGVDYQTLTGQVVIEAGRSSAQVAVNPLPDGLLEGVEDVILSLADHWGAPSSEGRCSRYLVGTPATAHATILDSVWVPNRSPRIEIVRPYEGEAFQVPADIAIVVQAVDPDGWVPRVEFFGDGVKIGEQNIAFLVEPPPGETQTFSMVWSNAPAGTHVLTARARDDDGAETMSTPVNLSVIQPNLPPVVSVFATDPFAREKPMNGQTNTATFRIRRTGGTNEALRVWYSVHGTAENGRDYMEIPGGNNAWGSVEIPAGRRSVGITIQPLNDDLPERVETVVLKLEPAPILAPIELYHIGLPDCAGAIIVDGDSQTRPPVHRLADGTFHVTLPGQNGLAYRLECSTNLRDWVSVADGVVTDGWIHYVDPVPNRAGSRFYRVRPIVTQAMEVDDD